MLTEGGGYAGGEGHLEEDPVFIVDPIRALLEAGRKESGRRERKGREKSRREGEGEGEEGKSSSMM